MEKDEDIEEKDEEEVGALKNATVLKENSVPKENTEEKTKKKKRKHRESEHKRN